MLADHCIQKGEALQASEGAYEGEEGRPMICMGLEEVAGFLLAEHRFTPRSKPMPVIEAVDMTEEQEKIFHEWKDPNGDIMNWDCGDDGNGGEYGILDSIKFRFAPGWRKRYPEIPVLGNVTN